MNDQTKIAENELLPCPFCGEKAREFIEDGYLQIFCVCSPEPCCSEDTKKVSRDELVKQWNTRHPITPRENTKEIAERLADLACGEKTFANNTAIRVVAERVITEALAEKEKHLTRALEGRKQFLEQLTAERGNSAGLRVTLSLVQEQLDNERERVKRLEEALVTCQNGFEYLHGRVNCTAYLNTIKQALTPEKKV